MLKFPAILVAAIAIGAVQTGCGTADPSEAILSTELPLCAATRNLARDPGVTATAQSSYGDYSPQRVIDGDRNTTVGPAYSWANAHTYGPDGRLPQWLEIDLHAARSFNQIDLYTSAGYAIKNYDIEAWDGGAWTPIVSQVDNQATMISHSFPDVTASKVRVIGRRGPDNQYVYVRVNELEIYGCDGDGDGGVWTPWLNRDLPSGNGDYETLPDFLAAGQACATPMAIECRTLSGVDYRNAGQNYTCEANVGGFCRNAENGARCLDYEVRFLCPQ